MSKLAGLVLGVGALVGALVLAGAAVGVPPKAGTLFGGGFAPANPNSGYAQYVSIRVLSSTKATMWASIQGYDSSVSQYCPGDVLVVPIRLQANGAFAGTFEYKRNPKDDFADGLLTYKGVLSAGGKASGTFRFKWGEVDPGLHPKCDTGMVAWQAAAPSTTSSGVLAKGAVYGGSTNQRSTRAPVTMPIALRVAQNAKTLVAYTVTNVVCTKDKSWAGASGAFYDVAPLNAAAGSFSHDDTFSYEADGKKLIYTMKFTGKFGGHAVKGTWHLDAVVKDGSGAEVDRCTSGTISWQAAR